MLQTKVLYKAFAFIISSEIPLPELLPVDETEKANANVVIEMGDLTDIWQKIGVRGKFTVDDERVIFQIKNIATICVQEGERVIVSPLEKFDEDKVRLYLLGTCMSILLLQCRILPLHGSAVAIDGKAYAVVGESGAGKSTLASAFLHKGFQLLSDDVIAVSLSETRLPIVIPSYPQQKLWQESLNQLGMEPNGYQPLFERETKFSVPIISKFQKDSLPLAGIFELVTSKKNGVSLYSVSKLQGLDMLFHHTFRQFLISRLGLLEWHFTYTANVIQQIDLFKLKRSREEFTAEILTEVILEQIRGGNK